MDDQSYFIELNGKLERLMDGIESVKEKQEEMAEHLTKIKDAVYDPDQGLYARLRNLEQWKEASSRVQWIIITSLLGLGLATLWNVMVQQ
tara:strand:+ start:362 stop:631 length:270 start_codon:yes stop_codon:yes gene_type:complete